MTPADLDLIETDVILDALYRRFDGGVLLVTNKRMSKTGEDNNVYYCGGRVMAMGLAAYATAAITAPPLSI